MPLSRGSRSREKRENQDKSQNLQLGAGFTQRNVRPPPHRVHGGTTCLWYRAVSGRKSSKNQCAAMHTAAFAINHIMEKFNLRYELRQVQTEASKKAEVDVPD